jgi:hypothetical protein
MKTKITTIMILLISFTGLSTNYYVNDNSTVGDVYCTAVGSSSNNGKSKSLPKQTLTQINIAYTLATGDTVFIDAGTYTSDKGFTWSVGIVIQGAGSTLTILDFSATHNNYFAYWNNGGVTSNINVSINKLTFKGYSSTNILYGSVLTFAGNNTHTCTLNLNSVEITSCGHSGTSAPCVMIGGYTNFNMTNGGFLCNGDATNNYNGSAIQVSGTNNTVVSVLSKVSFIGNYTCYPTNTSTSQPCSLINLLANSPITQGGNNSFSISNCLFDSNTLDQNYAGGYAGSCIYMAHGSLTITSSMFSNNSVSTTASTSYGSVCSITGGNVNITSSEFTTSSGVSGSGSLSGTISAYSTNNSITLNIGTNGANTSGCSFSNNANNNGNDLYAKQSGANTNTVNAYYTSFSSSSSIGSIYAINFNNANGGSVTISNCGSPTNNLTITKTNTTASPSFTLPSVPTYTGTCGAIVLPIELLYFKGESNINYNKLFWSTASEYNNDYFTVIKTRDGTNFYNVGFVKGAGNSNQILYYQYIDNNIEEGINYYTLKQTDFDGNTKESDIISIDNRKEFTATLIKITNTLGQEVSSESSGILLYHYSDGTIIKRIL